MWWRHTKLVTFIAVDFNSTKKISHLALDSMLGSSVSLLATPSITFSKVLRSTLNPQGSLLRAFHPAGVRGVRTDTSIFLSEMVMFYHDRVGVSVLPECVYDLPAGFGHKSGVATPQYVPSWRSML